MTRLLSHFSYPRRAAVGTVYAASRAFPINKTRCTTGHLTRGSLQSLVSERDNGMMGGRGREGGREEKGIRALSAAPESPHPRLSAEEAKAVAGYVFPDKAVAYTRKDAILYALGIGETALRHVYESHPDFAPFPTLPLILSFKGTSTDIVPFGHEQALIPPLLAHLPLSSIVHGDESFQLLKPLPPEGTKLVNRSRVVALTDKGSGALLRVETQLLDAHHTPLAMHESGLFLKGMGDFGGEKGARNTSPKLPEREPDRVVTIATLPEQALLYRLSGDYNSLHIDPTLARSVGFKRPILHGLCTFALVARAVISGTDSADSSLLRSLKGRFAAPVYPGESLVVQLWYGADDLVLLRATVKEEGAEDRVVFSDGVARLVPASSKP